MAIGLTKQYIFKTGDLVSYRQNLYNREFPAGTVGVVLSDEVLISADKYISGILVHFQRPSNIGGYYETIVPFDSIFKVED